MFIKNLSFDELRSTEEKRLITIVNKYSSQYIAT
jgi:hypothetical protein